MAAASDSQSADALRGAARRFAAQLCTHITTHIQRSAPAGVTWRFEQQCSSAVKRQQPAWGRSIGNTYLAVMDISPGSVSWRHWCKNSITPRQYAPRCTTSVTFCQRAFVMSISSNRNGVCHGSAIGKSVHQALARGRGSV